MTRPGDDRKRTILDAVVHVIVEVGFTAMTVADVARRAGVSTALVHYHFSSKVDLITAALRMAGDVDIAARDQIVARDATAVARLDSVLTYSMPESTDDESWLVWIETWGETRRLPDVRTVMEELDSHETSVVVALLDAGNAAGEFECRDVARTSRRLLALRDGLAIQQTLFGSASDPDDFVTLLRGSIARNLGLTLDRYAEMAAIGV